MSSKPYMHDTPSDDGTPFCDGTPSCDGTQCTDCTTRDIVAQSYPQGAQPIRKILKIVITLGLSAMILAGFFMALDQQPVRAQPISPNLSHSSKAASVDRLPEGEVVDYTIVIENIGTETATHTILSDTLPTGIVYVPGSAWATAGTVTGTDSVIAWQGIVTGASAVTISFDTTVTAAPGDTVTNTAVISDPSLNAPVVVSVTNAVIPYVAFDLTKVVTPTIAEPGDRVTYTVRFTNTGRASASDTQLVDWIPNYTTYNNDAVASRAVLIDNATAITWTGDLAVGEATAITFSVQISDTYHGYITNTARISQTYLAQPIEQEVVATGIPVLSIKKLATDPVPPAPVGPGKSLTYKLTVQNDGALASGLWITDRLPMSTTFQASDGTFIASTGVISWTPSFTLSTGDEATFTFTVQVDPTVVSGTMIVNADYRVTSAEGAEAMGKAYETEVQDPILAISKRTDPDPPGANRTLTYRVAVENDGSLATDLLITDIVPTQAGIVTYTTGGTHDLATGLVTWTHPSLAFGKSKIFTYAVEIGNVPSGTEIVNGGYAVACSESITATGEPLTSTIEPPILETSYKYADPVSVKPGADADLKFIVVISNTGASNAIGAIMTDTFDIDDADFSNCDASSGTVTCIKAGGYSSAEWKGNISSGQTIYITLPTHIKVAGPMTNTAYITDDLLSKTQLVSTTALVTNDPALEVSKVAEPDPVAPGRLITYTLTVINYGQPTSDFIILTDTIPADTTFFTSPNGTHITTTDTVSWTLPKLTPGESRERHLVVRVDDVPAGTWIYNHDYAANCDNCAGVRGVTVTTQVQLPLQASKEVTPGLVRAGELLTFTVAVENVFGETAWQTMISDTIPAHTDYVAGSLDYPFGMASEDAAIQAQGYITWSGDIPPYETVVMTFQTKVKSSFSYGEIWNTAVVSQANLVYRPLRARAKANVSTKPVLELTKTPSAATIEPLSRLTYTLHLTNAGREATDIVITDSLPLNTSYLASTGGEQDGTLITEPTEIVSWTWPVMAYGDHLSVTLVVSVSNVPSGTLIVNDDYVATCAEGDSTLGDPVTTTIYVPLPPLAPVVTAIAPATMLNLQSLTTIITGSDFVETPAATLDSVTLAVTWVDATKLEAVMPKGMAPGVYDLTVTNDDEVGAPFDVLPNAFTVTNEVASFTFSPILTQTAGVPFTLSLTAVDAFGHPVPDYTGVVTLTDATGTISPTTNPAFVNGTISFTAIITGADVGVVITATDGTLSGSSGGFTVEPATFAGFSFTTIYTQTVDAAFTVEIWAVDAYGNMGVGYNGTAALTDTTGTILPASTGAFVDSMWSGNVTVGQLGAAVVITASDGGFDGASNAFAVINPAPTLLAVAPDTFTNLAPHPVVITGTNFITPVAAFAGTTAMTVTNATATRVDAVVPAGLAPGWYDVRVANAGPGAPSDTLTDALTITNALDHFAFGAVLTQTAGVSFTVVITAEDAFGWRVVDYMGSATLSDSTGTLSPTTTPSFTAGTVAATLTITRAQQGVTITAQDGVQAGTSQAFDVLHASLDHFAFDPLGAQVAGVPFSITITAVDAFGNPIPDYTGPNVLADTTGTLSPTLTSTFSDGMVQVTGTITDAQVGVVISTWNQATGAVPPLGESNAFDVVAGPLDVIVIAPQPILTQTVGQSFAITLTVMDAYGNVLSDFNGTVALSDTTGTITPTEVMCNNGIWAGAVTITQDHPEVYIIALESGVARGRSNAFAVMGGPLADFVFSSILTQTVGVPFTITIMAVDAFDNPVTVYTGTNTLTDTTGTITPTLTPAFVNGTVQLMVTVNQAQVQDVITTTDGGQLGTSNAFAVVKSTWDIYLPLVSRDYP